MNRAASEAATAADDLASQMDWRGVRAKILALRGEHRRAEALARTAVAFAEETDLLNMAGDAHPPALRLCAYRSFVERSLRNQLTPGLRCPSIVVGTGGDALEP